MNNALIIGVILIIAGIALAVVAYMVITSGDKDDEEIESVESDQPVTPSATGEVETYDMEIDEPQEAEDVVQAELEVEPSIEPTSVEAPAEEDSRELEEEPAPEPATPATPAAEAARIQVATLLRDDVSGELIIRVGEREYTSPDDLRSSPDWTRVEYAASDLNAWISAPMGDTSAHDEAETEGETEIKTADHKPTSMIEQINAILQERIEASGRSELAVRLIEGPGGMAKVLIGVDSYDIAEVPDPEVRELIREAVATWESTQ
jgi:hypothetical protein